MLNLRELYRDYKETSKSFSELVPWMTMVGPDLVLNLDGSLLMVYAFKGVDAEGLLVEQSDQYANLLELGLKACDEHITLWSTVDRRKIEDYPEGVFATLVGNIINRSWKKKVTSGNQYANNHYMAFMYSAGTGAEGFFESVSANLKTHQKGMLSAILETAKTFTSKRLAVNQKLSQLNVMKSIFNSKMREFEETVSELGFERLKGKKLLSGLHTRCNPATANQPVNMPEAAMYLNTWLPDNTLVREHDQLIFKDNESVHVGALTVKGWPNRASPGIVDALLTAQTELTVSQIFRFVASDKAERHLESIEEHHRSSAKSLMTTVVEAFTKKESDQINTGKLLLAEDAQHAMQELTVHNRLYGYYNMTVLGYGKNQEELEENMKVIASGLRQRGFILMRESLHLLSTFTSTMWGQWATSFRWSFMNIGNVADLAMIRTMSVGEKVNAHLTEQSKRPQAALTVFPTEYSTPYYFSFHETDLAHTLVIGPAGAGKTSLISFLISQFEKHSPCNRIIFDKDYSCMIPTLLQNGSHIDMNPEANAKVRLNPFKLLADPTNILWLVEFVKMLITSRKYELKAGDDQKLMVAMKNLSTQPAHLWTFSDFANAVPDNQLKEEMQLWLKGGHFGDYFDNDDDEFSLNSFVAIEMGGLLESEVAAPFMEYAFFRINKMLDGKPTLIYIEECWFMLRDKIFSAKINDWLKTLRKKNAFVIMATQSLHEIATSDIFATMIDNMPNRIYLANPEAYAHEETYRTKFGLNSTQIDRIQNAISKVQYYFVTRKMARLVNVRLPREIVVCTSSDELSKSVFRKHYQNGQGVHGWQVNYIKERMGQNDPK